MSGNPSSRPPAGGESEPPSSRRPPSIHPGRVIAEKYRIDSMLGEGAMGTVWAATHVNLGQRVAVKLISPDYARSKEARQRFDAEAKAAAMLRSRFVVQIFDSGVTKDGTPYLVMEYLNGESLEDRVERAGPLSLEQAVRVVTQVARALSRAHEQNIVHRDLKPANIFLAETDDGEEVAKVLDFGIAKMLSADRDQSATATGAVLGTPLFMSPEQARGLKTVDHRSDLYSLGMVAYRALTGEYAFSGEAFGDLLLAICTHPLPNIHHVAPWLPPALDEWFQRACAREAANRFQSAEELVEALLNAASVTASDVNMTTVLGTPSARFRDSLADVRSSAVGHAPPFDSAPINFSDSSTDVDERASTVALDAIGTGPGGLTAPRELVPRKPPVALIAAIVLGLLVVAGVAIFAFGSTPPAEAETPRVDEGPAAAAAPASEPAPEADEGMASSEEPEESDEGEPTSEEGAGDEPTEGTEGEEAAETTSPAPVPAPIVAKRAPKPRPAVRPKPAPKPAPSPKPQPQPLGGVDVGF